MISGLFFSKSDAATLLIALASGYIVCYLAKREEGYLRKLGFALGVFIIVATIVLLLGKLSMRIRSSIEIGKKFFQYKEMIQEKPAAVPAKTPAHPKR